MTYSSHAHGFILLPSGYVGGAITIWACATRAGTYKKIEDRESTGDLVMPTIVADKWNELPDRVFPALFLKFVMAAGSDVVTEYMLKG